PVLVTAELLVPPDGFAPLELGLRLADVGRELGFLLRQVRLELRKRRLSDLDLVRSEVDVRVESGLALLDLRLALVELADAVADRILHPREPMFAQFLALRGRVG